MSRHPILQKRVGHRFRDAALLEQALTHRSFGSPHNERLEFLGDSVLGCAIAEVLYARFPEAGEGALHQLRAELIREATLAQVASAIGLPAFIRLGGAAAAGGVALRTSVLADTLEAVIGAAFLDGGYDAAKAVIRSCFGEILARADLATLTKDAKTRLQELLQGRRKVHPRYRLLQTRGAGAQQTFEVECYVEKLGLSAAGTGRSRRDAEQKAASAMLAQLGE